MYDEYLPQELLDGYDAIATLCSTDNRYTDDIHYMCGCLLGGLLSWASIVFGRDALPPDPANVGKDGGICGCGGSTAAACG